MNPFQEQYPLSPRKYWKKMIGSIVGSVVLFVIIVPFLVLLSFAAQDAAITAMIGMGIFILIIIMVVYLLLRSWYWKVYIRRYYYEGSGNFVTIRKGVFAPREIHVQWQKIQDVYVDQDLIDRIMGLFDVHIASATMASGMEAHIDGVDEATATSLKNYFLQRLSGPQTPVASGGAAAPSAAPSVAPVAYQFSEPISSTQFPFSGRYTLRNVIGMFFTAIFATLFLTAWLSSPGKSGEVPIFSDPAVAFIVALVLSVAYFIGHLIYFFVWKKNYRFEFTPEFIYLHIGVISRSEKHVPYRTVQDVTVSQSVLDRIFGLSNVVIENASANGYVPNNARGLGSLNTANKITIPGQSPVSAAKISDALKEVVLSKNSAQTGL